MKNFNSKKRLCFQWQILFEYRQGIQFAEIFFYQFSIEINNKNNSDKKKNLIIIIIIIVIVVVCIFLNRIESNRIIIKIEQ